MSIQSMTWALEQRVVTDATTRHVLLCLANYADKDGRGSFPSASSLSEDTGLSERTVRYKLDALEKMGVIRRGNQAIAAAYIDRSDRRPVVYDIVMSRVQQLHPVEVDGVQMKTERGANEDATGCTSCTQSVIDPSINRKAIRHPKGDAAPEWVSAEAMVDSMPGLTLGVAKDYLAMRRTKRAKLTDRAWKGISKTLHELARHRVTPDDALSKAIERAWTGLEVSWFRNAGLLPASTGTLTNLPTHTPSPENFDGRF
ncbi:helix-turn-helix domain-containing protein [Pseudomonas tohonis]|nr:helix-turn-helix domain-containing protein [Pseudomonas tohonis]